MKVAKIAELKDMNLFVDTTDLPKNKWYAFDGSKMKRYRNIDTGEEVVVLEKTEVTKS